MADTPTKVLLVDDEEDFLNSLAKRLSLRRLEVFSATSAYKALEILAANSVDVVLLDMKMPGMDGMQAIREIKKSYPLVEVILLTGHADLESSLEGMTLGAFDYLLKPVAIDELVYKIQDAHRKKLLQEQNKAALDAEAPQKQ